MQTKLQAKDIGSMSFEFALVTGYADYSPNKKDPSKDKLIFYCRNCGNEETNLTAENICVSSFENVDNNDNHETYINEFTKLDPTLPRINNIKCPNKIKLIYDYTLNKRYAFYA